MSNLEITYGSPYARALKSKCHVCCWFVVRRYWNYVLSILPFILGFYHHFPIIYYMFHAFEQSLSLSLSIQYSNVPRISPFLWWVMLGLFHLPCPMGPMGIHGAQKYPWNPGCTSPDNDATSLFTTHHQPDRGHCVASRDGLYPLVSSAPWRAGSHGPYRNRWFS